MPPHPIRRPSLPLHHAFVVQLSADAQIEAGWIDGRVEHIVTGRATYFESLETLVSFFAQMLQDASHLADEGDEGPVDRP